MTSSQHLHKLLNMHLWCSLPRRRVNPTVFIRRSNHLFLGSWRLWPNGKRQREKSQKIWPTDTWAALRTILYLSCSEWKALTDKIRSGLRRDKSIFWPLQFLDPQSWLLVLDPELCEYLNLKPVSLNPWSWFPDPWSWTLWSWSPDTGWLKFMNAWQQWVWFQWGAVDYGGRRSGRGKDQQPSVLFGQVLLSYMVLSSYRVFFLTGTPLKS